MQSVVPDENTDLTTARKKVIEVMQYFAGNSISITVVLTSLREVHSHQIILYHGKKNVVEVMHQLSSVMLTLMRVWILHWHEKVVEVMQRLLIT